MILEFTTQLTKKTTKRKLNPEGRSKMKTEQWGGKSDKHVNKSKIKKDDVMGSD